MWRSQNRSAELTTRCCVKYPICIPTPLRPWFIAFGEFVELQPGLDSPGGPSRALQFRKVNKACEQDNWRIALPSIDTLSASVTCRVANYSFYLMATISPLIYDLVSHRFYFHVDHSVFARAQHLLRFVCLVVMTDPSVPVTYPEPLFCVGQGQQ